MAAASAVVGARGLGVAVVAVVIVAVVQAAAAAATNGGEVVNAPAGPEQHQHLYDDSCGSSSNFLCKSGNW